MANGTTFTGGGVTAGIAFAFTVMAEIAGPSVAQAAQLGLEYDAHPPFHAGTPALAPAQIKDVVDQRYLREFGPILERVAARF